MMADGHHEITSYIDDLPMKISKKYQPLHINGYLTQIPDIKPNDSDQFQYSFQVEVSALKVSQLKEQQIQELKRQREQEELEEQTKQLQLDGQDRTENDAEVVSDQTADSQETDQKTSQLIINNDIQNVNNTVCKATNDNVNYASFPNQDVTPNLHYSSVSNISDPRTHFVPFVYPSFPFLTQVHQPNFPLQTQFQTTTNYYMGILQPQQQQTQPTTSKSAPNNLNNIANVPMKSINPADFESGGSSPFDEALLRAIDDKQELNRVFEQVYSQPGSNNYDPKRTPSSS